MGIMVVGVMAQHQHSQEEYWIPHVLQYYTLIFDLDMIVIDLNDQQQTQSHHLDHLIDKRIETQIPIHLHDVEYHSILIGSMGVGLLIDSLILRDDQIEE